MIHSENINEIAAALSKAQGAMKPASKDGANPHFKSKFSTLSAIWEAIREPVTANGLTILQDIIAQDKSISVTTKIIHNSGQWIEFGPLCIPLAKADAQGIGSCSSYAKRYALCAAIGVVSDDDDDGECAVGRGNNPNPKQRNDYVTKPNNIVSPTVSQEPIEKIDASQEHMILEALAQTDDAFKKEFYHKLLHSYQAHHLNELPLNRFSSALQWIKNNIERIKNEGGA